MYSQGSNFKLILLCTRLEFRQLMATPSFELLQAASQSCWTLERAPNAQACAIGLVTWPITFPAEEFDWRFPETAGWTGWKLHGEWHEEARVDWIPCSPPNFIDIFFSKVLKSWEGQGFGKQDLQADLGCRLSPLSMYESVADEEHMFRHLTFVVTGYCYIIPCLLIA
jgi:hypothetical protein